MGDGSRLNHKIAEHPIASACPIGPRMHQNPEPPRPTEPMPNRNSEIPTELAGARSGSTACGHRDRTFSEPSAELGRAGFRLTRPHRLEARRSIHDASKRTLYGEQRPGADARTQLRFSLSSSAGGHRRGSDTGHRKRALYGLYFLPWHGVVGTACVPDALHRLHSMYLRNDSSGTSAGIFTRENSC